MRAILFILIIAVVVLLIGVGTGFIDINQTRHAKAPRIATDGGVKASGGQAPAFDVETGSVAVGTKTKNVKVPTLEVVPPDRQDQNAANTAG
jgi:hypothetical protein